MTLKFLGAAGMALLAGCSYVDSYEEAVHDFEPVYCYQSLAGVTCQRTPDHTDSARLVNYYGKHPSRYDAPEKPDVAELKAPPPVDFWVKDPEPVPTPRVKLAELKKKAAESPEN